MNLIISVQLRAEPNASVISDEEVIDSLAGILSSTGISGNMIRKVDRIEVRNDTSSFIVEGNVGASLGTLGYHTADELMEVTPKSIRLRKKLLTENERKRAGKK